LRKRILSVGFGILLSLSQAIAQEGAVTLEYRYQPGQVLQYDYTVTMEGDVSSLEGIPSQGFTATLLSKVTLETQSIEPDGSAWVDVRYDDLSFSQEINGEKMESDEESFQGILGKTVSLRFRKDGKFLETKGNTEEIPTPSFQQVFGQMEGIFPDRPVRVGEAWTKEVALPMEGVSEEVVVTFQNVLKAFETLHGRRCAKIQSTLSFSLPEGPVEDELGTFQMSVGMEGKGEIEQYFDVAEGIMVKSEGTTQTTSTQKVILPTGEGTSPKEIESTSWMRMHFKTELE